MAIAKKWSAEAIRGIAGRELIVRGEANVGRLEVMPELKEIVPQGSNPTILLLELLNAGDATPAKFQPVQLNKELIEINQYRLVQFDYTEDTELLEDGDLQPEPPPGCTLKTLWQWVRLPKKDWQKLLEDMDAFSGPFFKEAVRQSANEIIKLSEAGDRTWGAIIATVLQCTDFIKSPALQQSLESGFNPYRLADGNTALYIIIPADKLQSHARWLRLVTTTTMRAVVRKPNKRVTFLLDEFSALGYLPEIETALSTYAGFEITVWPILQSLSQLKAHYKDSWETFVGNSTIRHFFSVNDNFTADYVSKAAGMRSYVITKSQGNIEEAQSNQRPLITPDELRRLSGDNIFTFMGAKPITTGRIRRGGNS
ncbi:hypothetical protein OSTOST_10611 [Ostertagia ostertagi]